MYSVHEHALARWLASTFSCAHAACKIVCALVELTSRPASACPSSGSPVRLLPQFDSDGFADALLADGIYWNNGDATFTKEAAPTVTSSVGSIADSNGGGSSPAACADLDADGHVDLVLGSSIWYSNGDKTFANEDTASLGGATSKVRSHHLKGHPPTSMPRLLSSSLT